MSERPHASAFEDNESDSSTPPQRPGVLPIPHLAEMKAPTHITAEQSRPKPERPPLILFDRAFEAQVSVPSIGHVPEAAQDAIKATAESDEELSDDDDEEAVAEATEPAEAAEHEQPVIITPAGQRVESLHMFHAEAAQEADPAIDPQYASPVIPTIPRPRSTPQAVESFDYIPAETAVAEPMSAADFEEHFAADPPSAESVPNAHYADGAEQPAFFRPDSSPDVPPVPPVPPAGSHSGGGFPPVPPPRRPVNSYGSQPGGSNPNTAYQYAYNAAPSINPNVITNQGYTDDDLHRARQSGARQGVVAGALAGGLAGRYFANRKARREQKIMKAEHAAELEQRDATLAQHAQDIDKLKGVPELRDAITGRYVPGSAERPAAAPSTVASSERPAFSTAPTQRAGEFARPATVRTAEAPAVGVQPEAIAPEQAADQQPNPFEKQSDEPHHKIRSEWLEIGVDQHGRAVQQEYGRAFQEETRQEQTGNRTFTSDPRSKQSGMHENQPHSAGYYIGAPHIGTGHQLNSGQLPNEQRLQPGTPTRQDPQHLLPSPKKQVASNIINPWFWLMLAIVIVVFFAAASL